ncbi:DUF3346 domain-containing protein [Vibrio parahaemolyticus]|uniref:replication initiator protein RctB domain-containing protein n=1 Tax=Vibrio TaxID=662 RepID=UPI001A8FD529|nr:MULTISPECIES: replication initiator protein RctB domain-containing protein [Vibrio]EGQ7973669.1 DUF3346 domain-containing protein [Vibrio parahaemolyticus]MBO0209879.1 DUF3346 domain-containing protein [Vibrio sp. Vb0877]MCR9811941.1 DUF3346 domain-containing protein [Vibrio parahaemolyticus]MDW2320200.1 DUF3346 domain-containing protein [Vibrio sp. 1159]
MSESETEIIVRHKTASDGSLLIIPDIYKDVDVATLNFENQKVSSQLVETVKLFISQMGLADEQNIISIAQLSDATELKLTTLQARIRTLRKKGFLTSVPFKFSDGSFKPKILCEVLSIEILHESYSPEESKSDKKIVDNRWQTKALLKKHGINPLPDVKKNLPPVVRHKGNNLIDQLVGTEIRKNRSIKREEITQPAANSRRKFFIKVVDGNEVVTKTVSTTVRSYSNIMDPFDLQVLYAVYSLIYNYHNYYLVEKGLDIAELKNLTPINVDHIIDFLGKARGGPNRAIIRNSLYAIADTCYDLLGMKKFELYDGTLDSYAIEEYRNFEKFWPLGHLEEDINNPDEVKLNSDTMLYMIQLPSHVFKKLMTEQYLFAFPQKALEVSAIIFMLYLRFRVLCQDDKYDAFLASICKSLSTNGELDQFKRDIRTGLNQINNKASLIADDHLSCKYFKEIDTYKFNLWGYHGTISFREDFLSVTCDKDEMIKCCNSDPNGDDSAPTIINEISYLIPENVNKKVQRSISSIISRRLKKYSINYEILGYPLEFTKYVSDDDKAQIIELLSRYYSINSLALELQINEDFEKLMGLKIRDIELSREQFLELISLTDIDLFDINEVDLINRIQRKVSIHNDIYSLVIEGAEATDNLCESLKDIESQIRKSPHKLPEFQEVLDLIREQQSQVIHDSEVFSNDRVIEGEFVRK